MTNDRTHDTTDLHAAPGSTPAGTAGRDAFYRDVLEHMNASGVPYLIGGAYGFAAVTGIGTRTKDLDLFVRHVDLERVLRGFQQQGHETEVPFPHWLAKVRNGGDVVDVIFNSGNGATPVDDEWMRHAIPADVLGVPIRLCAVEEMIWTKSFVMERERFDGSDVAHLICARAEQLDWPRLIRRFGLNLAVLLSHLILFCFIYPGECDRLPEGLIDNLIRQVRGQAPHAGGMRLCRGGLLSRAQYLVDFYDWGYVDARRRPHGNMSDAELDIWTDAAPERPHAITSGE